VVLVETTILPISSSLVVLLGSPRVSRQPPPPLAALLLLAIVQDYRFVVAPCRTSIDLPNTGIYFRIGPFRLAL
jgi:hypothetical protein